MSPVNASYFLFVVLSAFVFSVNGKAYYDAIVVDAEGRSDDTEPMTRRRVDPADCLLPKSTGPCRGFFQSFYYNRETKRCDPFIWSGCGGNNNRFEAIEDCEKQCGTAKKERHTNERLTKRCNRDVVPPVCGKSCRLTKDANNCPKCDCSYHKAVCSLPAVRGHCRALLPRWRYDPAVGKCVEFKFGGCDGNGNNFRTEQQCMKTCGGY